MNCPNCAAANPEEATHCAGCKRSLHAKATASPFKSTMVMGAAGHVSAGAGTPAPGSRQSHGAAPIKKTIVGVESPFAASPQPRTPPAKRPFAKQTMVGVTGVGLRGPDVSLAASTQTEEMPVASPTTSGAAPRPSPANLKQTMVGVAAPPGAEPASPVAGTQTAVGKSPGATAIPKQTMVGVTGLGQSGTPAAPPPAGPAKTMMGVPPGGPGQAPDGADPTGLEFKRTVMGVAPQAQADPRFNKKGTMVGVTPVGAEQAGFEPTVTMPQIDPASLENTQSGAAAPRHTAPVQPRLIGKRRSPTLCLLWMLLIIPGLIQFFRMLGELNRFRAKDDCSPWLFFVPVVSLFKLIELCGKLKESQAIAGVREPRAPNPLLFIFFPLPLFAASLNEIWIAARQNS